MVTPLQILALAIAVTGLVASCVALTMALIAMGRSGR